MSVEWYTPSNIIEAARRAMGGIDLDPASCEEANRTVRADRFFSIAQDGLLQPWEGRVWLNPPFGAVDTRAFISRAVNLFDRGVIEQACILIPHTPGCGVFNTLVGRFANCHPRDFVWFDRPGLKRQKIQFPVVMFYLGVITESFAEHFSAIGAVCVPIKSWAGFDGGLLG